MFLLFTAVLTTDLARLVAAIARRITRSGPIDAERRAFIARVMAGAIAAVVSGLTVIAVRSALRPVGVRRVRGRLARLSPAPHGLTIGPIPDSPLGPPTGGDSVEEILNPTN